MKIAHREQTEKDVKFIVSIGGKKFTRVQPMGKKNTKIIWKNTKTNSLVTQQRHKSLEAEFSKLNAIITTVLNPLKAVVNNTLKPRLPVSSGLRTGESTQKQMAIDSILSTFIYDKKLLEAVKAYKEASGLGLKESKEYVDTLNAIHLASKKSYLESDDLLASLINSFNKNSEKKIFISKCRAINRTYGELVCIKEIYNMKGWTVVESKYFYDKFIK
jgi:ribosomal protein L7/L12